MAITFERDELYRDVWSRPLTKIAEQFGLSDNGVRKVCKAMNIPLPRAGHWAKVAAGQVIVAEPLPSATERTTYVCHPPEADESEDAAEDKNWCREQERRERLPENQIVVDRNPGKWHPVLIPYRDSHRLAAKDYERVKVQTEKQRGKPEPRWGTPSWEASLKWNTYVRRGHILIDSHKALPLRVSYQAHERALTILNELFLSGERRGFEIGLSDGGKRFVFTGLGGRFEIRLVERIEIRDNPDLGSNPGAWEPKNISVPTGQLRLCLESYFGSSTKEFTDDVDNSLEAKLNSVFESAYRLVIRCREFTRLRAQEERRRELVRLQREELDRQHREAAQRVKEEQDRRRALDREASDWQKANLIRQYVSHIASMAPRAPSKDLTEWIEWSLHVADEIDPTSNKRSSDGDH